MYVNGKVAFKKNIKIHAIYSEALFVKIYGNDTQYITIGTIKLPRFKSI
jgi:hypothetical protein